MEQEQAMDVQQEQGQQEVSIRIGKDEIRQATETLKKYKAGKSNLEKRIIENEQWYKLRHWEIIRAKQGNQEPEPTSAWLFNSIANKHADAMDNYPEPSVLPRAMDDDEVAKQLSSILPVVLEQNEYEQVYSDTWWYKLKGGTGVKGVFWNQRKHNGLGDIDIRKLDILNLFWEPGITDIQKSRNVFHVELVDTDLLQQRFPDVKIQGGEQGLDIGKYVYDDNIDTSEKSIVVDWYYKLELDGREVVHLCKYVNDTVLYASENEPDLAEQGYYDHGQYPFVFDTLFVEEGTPAGFGYIDIMKDPQLYIDKLGQAIMTNAMMASKKRWFIRQDGVINEEEFADMSKPFIHASTNLGEDSLREWSTNPLPETYVNMMQQKIEELKETSGNRDFSQGSTSSGVTAASAIAALQEAGSKLSRDMLKSAYRAFQRECYLVIELMRQFYDAPRCFRITGEQGYSFEQFDNTGLRPTPQGIEFGVDLGFRKPEFDIKVVPAKKSAYSKLAQNEMALQFFGLGFFNPQLSDQALACLSMMDIEGKEKLMERIQANGTMYQMIQQLQQQMLQLATIVDAQNGTSITQGIAQSGANMAAAPNQGGTADISGLQDAGTTKVERARATAANRSTPG